MTELREIDGNGHVPETSSETANLPNPKMCGCCQRLRPDEPITMWGTLTDAGGKEWRICGKCISAMWRKRSPKLEPLV